MKRNIWIGLGIATAGALLVLSPGGAAETSPEKAAMTSFMRQKMVFTQGITEGLSLGKFDLVTKNAVKLRDMTQTNIWTRLGTPTYVAETKKYKDAVDAVYMAGADRDLDAATAAYARTLVSCVECHRQLRSGTVKAKE